MKQQSKLSQDQQHTEQQTGAQETRQQAGQEFAGADELLRFDATHTAVPPVIGERLKVSVAAAAAAAPPRRSWWKNLFGG